MPSLDELFSEEEARRRAETAREIERERAEWLALTPEQQAAHIAAVEAKFANVPDDYVDEDEEPEVESEDESHDD